MKKVVNKAHLKDIDFRKREVRQENAVEDFKNWYDELAALPYSERIQGQLSMLSAVLWHLLPKNEYKKLVTNKNTFMTEKDFQEQIAAELAWI